MKKISIRFETEECVNRFAMCADITPEELKTMGNFYYPEFRFKPRKRPYSNKVIPYNIKGMPKWKKEKGYVFHMNIHLNEDYQKQFEKEFDTEITGKTSFWYSPHLARYKGCYFDTDSKRKNKYPIYIPSKGRWNNCKTADYLLRMKIDDFLIVIEPEEYNLYLKKYNKNNLLVLDMSYKESYDTCDEYGTTRSTGSGPARNFIWDHSIERGYDWHWIIDDNVSGFVKKTPGNWRIPVRKPAFFSAAEEFITETCPDNVGAGSLNYRFFCADDRPPYQMNTRVYSIILIRNNIPFRWKGRYNEDSILSMEMLESGYQTVMLNWFLANKAATQTVRGGNTDELYADGTAEKSAMFHRLFPDNVELVKRWGRDHHFVDWKKLYPSDFEPPIGETDDLGYYLTSDNTDFTDRCLI